MSFIEFFEELLYGSGSLFGLILIVALLLFITVLHKYAGGIALILSVFLFINYIDNDAVWNGLIVLFTGIIMLFIGMAKGVKT